MPRSYPVEIRRQVVELARAGTRGNGGCAAAAGPGLTAAFAVQRSDASISAQSAVASVVTLASIISRCCCGTSNPIDAWPRSRSSSERGSASRGPCQQRPRACTSRRLPGRSRAAVMCRKSSRERSSSSRDPGFAASAGALGAGRPHGQLATNSMLTRASPRRRSTRTPSR